MHADKFMMNASQSTPQDATEYLLSTEANRHHLMTAIQNIETKTNLVSFTPEEWNEEYKLPFCTEAESEHSLFFCLFNQFIYF